MKKRILVLVVIVTVIFNLSYSGKELGAGEDMLPPNSIQLTKFN